MKVHIYSFVILALLAIGRASTECPAEDGESVVYLANSADCGTFYKCSGGEAILQECPGGLDWNDELQVCDWPESANCVATAGGEEVEEEEEVKQEAEEEVKEEVVSPTECPAEDGEDVVHLANPADCGSFYKCLNGVAYINLCPDSLEWNQELQVCDWPENANCVVAK